MTDGGAAFGHGSEMRHCCGATLRDYFAGQALPAILTHATELISDWTLDYCATRAYYYADAMLKARTVKR